MTRAIRNGTYLRQHLFTSIYSAPATPLIHIRLRLAHVLSIQTTQSGFTVSCVVRSFFWFISVPGFYVCGVARCSVVGKRRVIGPIQTRWTKRWFVVATTGRTSTETGIRAVCACISVGTALARVALSGRLLFTRQRRAFEWTRAHDRRIELTNRHIRQFSIEDCSHHTHTTKYC